jgi:hypothetical protein
MIEIEDLLDSCTSSASVLYYRKGKILRFYDGNDTLRCDMIEVGSFGFNTHYGVGIPSDRDFYERIPRDVSEQIMLMMAEAQAEAQGIIMKSRRKPAKETKGLVQRYTRIRPMGEFSVCSSSFDPESQDWFDFTYIIGNGNFYDCLNEIQSFWKTKSAMSKNDFEKIKKIHREMTEAINQVIEAWKNKKEEEK